MYDKISGKKYKRTNIVAGKCGEKIVSPLVYDGTMDSKFFEEWFKGMFLNEVEANKNLRLIFLPPYSPELNPIEKYGAVLKRKLKKINKMMRDS